MIMKGDVFLENNVGNVPIILSSCGRKINENNAIVDYTINQKIQDNTRKY